MPNFNVKKNISFFDLIISNFKNYFRHILQPFNDFNNYRKSFNNYFEIIKKKRTNDYPINVIFRNGNHVKLKNPDQLRTLRFLGVNNCALENDILVIRKKKLPQVKFFDWEKNGDFKAVFIDEEYHHLPVKDRVVIDIGANIGDSPIYFSIKGAKKVIALEPSPKNCESAKKNIELNNLSDKIHLVNAGCGKKNDTIKIRTENQGLIYAFEHNDSNYIKIPLMTLDYILKNYNVDSCVLKMDCEGCEYETILSASMTTLQKFSHIQLEYHFGYKNLKVKLEKSGFKVTVSHPMIGHRLYQDKHQSYVGHVYAERIS